MMTGYQWDLSEDKQISLDNVSRTNVAPGGSYRQSSLAVYNISTLDITQTGFLDQQGARLFSTQYPFQIAGYSDL